MWSECHSLMTVNMLFFNMLFDISSLKLLLKSFVLLFLSYKNPELAIISNTSLVTTLPNPGCILRHTIF